MVFITSRPPFASATGKAIGKRAGWESVELAVSSQGLGTCWNASGYYLDALGGVAMSVNKAIQ